MPTKLEADNEPNWTISSPTSNPCTHTHKHTHTHTHTNTHTNVHRYTCIRLIGWLVGGLDGV